MGAAAREIIDDRLERQRAAEAAAQAAEAGPAEPPAPPASADDLPPQAGEALASPAWSGPFDVDRCGSCSSPLALRSPTVDSPASAWLCRRCSSVFFARAQERDGKPFNAGARPVAYEEVMKAINVHVEGRADSALERDVRQLMDCLASTPARGSEARKQPRFPVAVSVTAVPLAGDLRVAAQPSRAITINVSGGGMAIVHRRRLEEPFLAVDFAASGVDLLPAILRINRVRSLGSAFELAGPFLCRIAP